MAEQFKLLVCIPSPRDIPEFERSMEDLSFDKIWIKYVGYNYEPNPYQRFVNYFLNHPEYTHLAIAPDDCLVPVKGAEKLWNHAKSGKKVVTGYANLDMKQLDVYPITKHKVHPDRSKRYYDLMDKNNLPKKMFKAGWQGTCFMIIERSIVEKLQWNGDMIDGYNKNLGIQAFDVGICYQLHKMKIPIWVDPDPDCKSYHMRYGGKIYVGEKQPDVWLDITGKPRIKNQLTMFNEVKEAYDDFVRNGGTRMSWVDNFYHKLMEYFEKTSKPEMSVPFKETLEVFKKPRRKSES